MVPRVLEVPILNLRRPLFKTSKISKISHPRNFPIYCDQFRSKPIKKISDFRLSVFKPTSVLRISVIFAKNWSFLNKNVPKTWIFFCLKIWIPSSLFWLKNRFEFHQISVFFLIFFEILTKNKISKSEGIFSRAEMAIRDYSKLRG